MDQQVQNLEIQKPEELEEIKEGAITVEKTDHGFKFKGKSSAFYCVWGSIILGLIALMVAAKYTGITELFK
jgi:hypothetical protein